MGEETPAWFKQRGYRHLDRPISLAAARRLVGSPEAVARHAFRPFISYTKQTPRYRKSERKVRMKLRPIAYASHVDSLIFAYYSSNLSLLYERELEALGLGDVVLAYRRFPGGKCNVHFASEAFADIERSSPCEAVALDIESFFDKLQHARLKEKWLQLLGMSRLPNDHYAVFRAVTSFAKVERGKLLRSLGLDEDSLRSEAGRTGPPQPLCSDAAFRDAFRADRSLVEMNRTGSGIPQGSPISGLLANLYLFDVDTACAARLQEMGGSYRRYSDDILLICPPGMGDAALGFVTERLADVGLSEASGKTMKSKFSKMEDSLRGEPPLQYLGFVFDGQRHLIRSQTLARLHRKMIHAVKCAVRDARRSRLRGGDARVWRRKLYQRFSHLGGRKTYFAYFRRSLKTMNDNALRKQHRRLWDLLHKRLREQTASPPVGRPERHSKSPKP